MKRGWHGDLSGINSGICGTVTAWQRRPRQVRRAAYWMARFPVVSSKVDVLTQIGFLQRRAGRSSATRTAKATIVLTPVAQPDRRTAWSRPRPDGQRAPVSSRSTRAMSEYHLCDTSTPGYILERQRRFDRSARRTPQLLDRCGLTSVAGRAEGALRSVVYPRNRYGLISARRPSTCRVHRRHHGRHLPGGGHLRPPVRAGMVSAATGGRGWRRRGGGRSGTGRLHRRERGGQAGRGWGPTRCSGGPHIEEGRPCLRGDSRGQHLDRTRRQVGRTPSSPKLPRGRQRDHQRGAIWRQAVDHGLNADLNHV